MQTINADRLIDEVERIIDEYPAECHGKEILLAVRKQPSVDPVKHGHFTEHFDPWGEPSYFCSRCGEEWVLPAGGTPYENGYLYCPGCGSMMDEPLESEVKVPEE